jgi:PKD domain-containing protein
VVNHPPVASLAVQAPPAVTGRSTTLDATASHDNDGTIVDYRWDLDGDGVYETDGGKVPTVNHIFNQTTEVGVRVTDDDSATAEARLTLTVLPPDAAASNHVPTATFTVSPTPARTGKPVTFDASGSSDPDGPLAKFEWDFDGDGTFEVDNGATPTATHTFARGGVYDVGLRVTDPIGASAVYNFKVLVGCTTDGRCIPTFTSRTSPTRDRKAPFSFTTTGKLTVPPGIRPVDGCTGKVVLQVLRGKRVVLSRTVSIDRFCEFLKSWKFKDRKKLGKAKTLRVVAKFRGNSLLTSRTARGQTIRIR